MSHPHPITKGNTHKPDVILLTDALRDLPLTGIGRYVLELARGLQAHPGLGEVRYFAGRGWMTDPCNLPVRGLGVSDEIPSLVGATPDTGSKRSFRGWFQPGALRRVLPCRCLQDRVSFAAKKISFWTKTRSDGTPVQHGPNYLLLPYDGPSVVTIHDLSFIHYPGYHPRERLVLLDRELPRTLRQADLILTDTHFVRREIMQILGVADHRISVTPLGVDPAFHPMSPEQTLPVLQKMHLNHGHYLLCVATREPRKNLSGLLAAYSGLPVGLQTDYPLTLAGSSGWLSDDLERLIRPLESSGLVQRLGYVPERSLPALVAGAGGLAMPSFYEGFGLPVLEAMACGVPVLTANRSSLPEVAGDAALLVDPEDDADIKNGLERLLTDDDFRRTARARGLWQSARFTWAQCVDQTVRAYHHVAGRRSLPRPQEPDTSNPGALQGAS